MFEPVDFSTAPLLLLSPSQAPGWLLPPALILLLPAGTPLLPACFLLLAVGMLLLPVSVMLLPAGRLLLPAIVSPPPVGMLLLPVRTCCHHCCCGRCHRCLH